MEKEKVLQLLEKYDQGQCTAKEKAAIEAWYNHYSSKQAPAVPEEDLDLEKAVIWSMIPEPRAPKIKKLGYGKYFAAAAAVAAITLGVWFYEMASSPDASRNDKVAARDISPGRNTAMLTLANGQRIQLSDAKSGIVINKSGLKYNDLSEIGSSLRFPGSEQVQMLSASTPRGGTYQVVLPDGTKVWLNAASSIKFPSAFVGKERRIVLTGEAYLEVAKVMIQENKARGKEKRMPFIVETNKQSVEVLGTHFNISSYADDSTVKTTLLEGAVRVSAAADLPGVFLKPGQQSVLGANNQITVKEANDDATAWKNGYFEFNDEDLQNVMKKLSRWYNVGISYEGGAARQGFTGKISRSNNLSEVLKALESTKTVHFKVEGRRIVVINK